MVDLAKLYPSMGAPAPAAPAPAAPATVTTEAAAPGTSREALTESQLTDALYGERPAAIAAREAVEATVPDAIRELREDDGLYEPARGQSTAVIDKFFEKIDAAPEAKAAAAQEWLKVAADMGGSSADIEMLVSTGGTADAAVLETWRAQSMQQLETKYGHDAGDALKVARQLAQRDPRVAALLEGSGLGSHPRIVMRLAELGLQQRTRGRLK